MIADEEVLVVSNLGLKELALWNIGILGGQQPQLSVSMHLLVVG